MVVRCASREAIRNSSPSSAIFAYIHVARMPQLLSIMVVDKEFLIVLTDVGDIPYEPRPFSGPVDFNAITDLKRKFPYVLRIGR